MITFANDYFEQRSKIWGAERWSYYLYMAMLVGCGPWEIYSKCGSLYISNILSQIPNGSIYRAKLWCFYSLPFYLLHICPHHTIVIKGKVWWVFPTQLLGKHTLLTNLIQMRRFKCRAGETWAVVFSTGKIVNYFGTDWSQSAIELDYWLNGKCNEKALIWKESYEKAISITLESLNWDTSTPHQTHSTGSDTLTFSLFLYFLSSFFPF